MEDTVRVSRLANGLTVATDTMPGIDSAALGYGSAWVRGTSRKARTAWRIFWNICCSRERNAAVPLISRRRSKMSAAI